MMNCQTTLSSLRQLLLDRIPVTEQALAAAQEHLHHCPLCQAKLARLVQAIETVKITEIDCAACQDAMADYYVIRQEDRTLPDEYLPVALHLLDCADCAIEFALVTDTMTAVNAGVLPPLLPAPSSIWPQVTEKVRRLFTDVILLVKEGSAHFGAMPAPLQPVAVMGSVRQREDFQTPSQLLELHSTQSGLNLTLQTLPKAEQGVTLLVFVKEAQTEAALANLRIRLYDSKHRLSQSLLTEARGVVRFDALQTGRYLIQIRHREQYEEVPILIVETTP